ncbi:MAG: hypothetical protein COU51_04230 [Parcubacteria group bacterium CG10_big_fil_rev_8_21_14_0_10_36_14]|nr:MAG: hypothetical protein COU51_04230 [Parcubacteria group bacterium CG10_big_fil_rev_8_21_14_0_10_36_14]
MKRKFNLLLCIVYLILGVSSCVIHEIESDERLDSSIPEKTLKNQIDEELHNLHPYKLYMFIPIVDAWSNANYNGFDYLSFFKKICKLENQIKTDSSYECTFSNKSIGLSIAEKNSIVITFKNFEITTPEGTKTISGIWQITGTPTVFILNKYERSCIDTECTLKIVDYTYNNEGREAFFSASGEIGLPYGRYYFYFDNFYFGTCRNKPVGRMYFQAGKDNAEAIFFEDTQCSSCVRVELNSCSMKFNYCNEWTMEDLFNEF